MATVCPLSQGGVGIDVVESRGSSLVVMSFTAGSLRGAHGVIDHRLARRALVNEYRRGRLRRDQVCDAHPELLRAARNVGQRSRTMCPICEEDQLVLVTYVFGPRLPKHGRIATSVGDLAAFNRRREEYAAYVVEACCTCRWHHLLRVLPLGGKGTKVRGAAAQ
jgi:hypothetical protein